MNAEEIFKSIDEQLAIYESHRIPFSSLYIEMSKEDFEKCQAFRETVFCKRPKRAKKKYRNVEIRVENIKLLSVCVVQDSSTIPFVKLVKPLENGAEITMPEEEAKCHSFIEPNKAHEGFIGKAIEEAQKTLTNMVCNGDFSQPLTHPNGTPFDASKIDTKPIETTPQVVPMKESDIVSREELNNLVLKNIVHNGDFSNFKADSWGNEPQTLPPFETELYINNVPIGKHLTNIDRLLTEAINLSYVSGDNTKAQMRDKIIEARRITEEIKRGK